MTQSNLLSIAKTIYSVNVSWHLEDKNIWWKYMGDCTNRESDEKEEIIILIAWGYDYNMDSDDEISQIRKCFTVELLNVIKFKLSYWHHEGVWYYFHNGQIRIRLSYPSSMLGYPPSNSLIEDKFHHKSNDSP